MAKSHDHGTSQVTDEDISIVTDALGPDELHRLYNNLNLLQNKVEIAEKNADTTDVLLKARSVLRWWRKTKGMAATRKALFDARDKVLRTRRLQDGGKYVTGLAEALKSHYSTTVCQKQLYPWKRDKIIDLNKTFVHLTMDKEIPHTGKSIKQRLETYDEVFIRDGTDRRFVLEGRPGLGKTTLCAKIAYDWSRGLALGHVMLLIVLRLGLINHNTSVEDAIIDQLKIPSTLCDHQELSKTLEELGSSIVIVLDALDEADPFLFERSRARFPFNTKSGLGLSTTILVALLAVVFILADGTIATSTFGGICIMFMILVISATVTVLIYKLSKIHDERSRLHNIIDIMQFNSGGLKQCQVLVTTRPWRVAQIMKIPEYKHLELQPFIKADIETYVKRFFTANKVLGGKLNSNYIKNNKLVVDASIPLITLLTSIVNGLGAIALQGLAAHRTRLVFPEKECTKYCTKEIVDTACQMGIISKKGDQKNSIEFFHKSAQEHLAGKYLANHQRDLKSYLGSMKTVQDALTIGPVLLSAAAENIQTAEQVMEKLMEIFVKEFDEPQRPNEDKISISSFYNNQLAITKRRQIQQFIELCIECNYEANAKERFNSALVKALFPNGEMYFFGIKPYSAVALGYLMTHIGATDQESTSPVTSLHLYCAPHPCDPQVFRGPVMLPHRAELKKVKYISSDDVREDVEKWKQNERRKHGHLHEELQKLNSTEMLAYIQIIQDCDGLPSISDSDITPVIKGLSNTNIKLIELAMDNYQSGFDELLVQIQYGHLDSLKMIDAQRTVSSGDQTTKFAKIVHKLPNIEALNIHKNKIEEGKTLPILAQNLANCKTLKRLSISDYNASADDMKMFVEKLSDRESDLKESEKFGHGLQLLQLKGNYITDGIACSLATRLPKTLNNLGITVCAAKDPQDLSLERHNELLVALRNLPNLKKLRIYDSPYPSHLLKCVFEGILSWNNLWGLTLCAQENEERQPMPPSVCKTMVESLTKYPATKIGDLRLAGIHLPDGVFKKLMEVGKEKEYSRLMYPRKHVSTEEETLARQKYEFVVLE